MAVTDDLIVKMSLSKFENFPVIHQRYDGKAPELEMFEQISRNCRALKVHTFFRSALAAREWLFFAVPDV